MLASAIVPLRLKTIVSLPVPAAQSPSAGIGLRVGVGNRLAQAAKVIAGDARIGQRIDGYRVGGAGVRRVSGREDSNRRNQEQQRGQHRRPRHPPCKIPGCRRQTNASPHPSNSAWPTVFCQAEFRPRGEFLQLPIVSHLNTQPEPPIVRCPATLQQTRLRPLRRQRMSSPTRPPHLGSRLTPICGLAASGLTRDGYIARPPSTWITAPVM